MIEWFNWALIGPIIALVLGVITTLVKYGNAKILLREFAEAITLMSAALEDDKITQYESRAIVKEWEDVYNAALKLLAK